MRKWTLLIGLVVAYCSCTDPAASRRKVVLSLSFKGILIKKFYDHNDRGDVRIILKSGESISVLSRCLCESTIVGDSVVKVKGEIYYKVYRNNDSFVCYPDCRGVEIRE